VDSGFGALGEEHGDDFFCRTVAEELAEGFFVVGNAVFFDEGDEVLGRVTSESGAGEVWIGGKEAFGPRVEIGEVAAASAGDEDLLADAVGVVEDKDAASAAAGLEGAHQTGGSGPEDEHVCLLASAGDGSCFGGHWLSL
jgi:hypothetical protein